MTYLESYFMIKIYIMMGFFTILGTVGTFWIVWEYILPYKLKQWINERFIHHNR